MNANVLRRWVVEAERAKGCAEDGNHFQALLARPRTSWISQDSCISGNQIGRHLLPLMAAYLCTYPSNSKLRYRNKS